MTFRMDPRQRLDFVVIPQKFYQNKGAFLQSCFLTEGSMSLARAIDDYYTDLIFSDDWEEPDFRLDPDWLYAGQKIRTKVKNYPDGIDLLYVSLPEPKEETCDYCKAYVLAYQRTEDKLDFAFISLYTIGLSYPADRCIGTVEESGVWVRLEDLPNSLEQALDRIHDMEANNRSQRQAPVALKPRNPVVPETKTPQDNPGSGAGNSWISHNHEEGWSEIHYTDENGHEMRVYGYTPTEPPKQPLTGHDKMIQDVHEMLECTYSLLTSLQDNLRQFRDQLAAEGRADSEDTELLTFRMDLDSEELKTYLYWLFEELKEEFGLPRELGGDAWKKNQTEKQPFADLNWLLMPYNFTMSCFGDLYSRLELLLSTRPYHVSRKYWLVLSDARLRLERFEKMLAAYGPEWDEIKKKM